MIKFFISKIIPRQINFDCEYFSAANLFPWQNVSPFGTFLCLFVPSSTFFFYLFARFVNVLMQNLFFSSASEFLNSNISKFTLTYLSIMFKMLFRVEAFFLCPKHLAQISASHLIKCLKETHTVLNDFLWQEWWNFDIFLQGKVAIFWINDETIPSKKHVWFSVHDFNKWKSIKIARTHFLIYFLYLYFDEIWLTDCTLDVSVCTLLKVACTSIFLQYYWWADEIRILRILETSL